ncbi:MAG: hypothetical protein GY822_11030 [Deltaproteobacteria bacterium]|nr:hypothetical protein [Deltaproteobacteria bacterium]
MKRNRRLSPEELSAIGHELGIETEFIEEASRQLYKKQQRRQLYRWLRNGFITLLLVTSLFALGGFFILRAGISGFQIRHDPYFAQQITLVHEAAPYLNEANQNALDERIAAFHIATDMNEKLNHMSQINAGLRQAVFFGSPLAT